MITSVLLSIKCCFMLENLEINMLFYLLPCVLLVHLSFSSRNKCLLFYRDTLCHVYLVLRPSIITLYLVLRPLTMTPSDTLPSDQILLLPLVASVFNFHLIPGSNLTSLRASLVIYHFGSESQQQMSLTRPVGCWIGCFHLSLGTKGFLFPGGRWET